jgi:CDP-glucose 4,6-dehydratase
VEDLVTDSFWRGRRVFLTGHTGFKGAWMSLWLQRLGAEVTGYSLAEAPTDPSLFALAEVGRGMRSLVGDVRDLGGLREALAAADPEVVVHMAAQSLVRQSYHDPVETYATNVMGTVNLLEAVRAAPSVRAVLVVTSDKCYENREWVWGYRENEPMGGHDPYSNSKGCAELVTSAYRRSFFEGADGRPRVLVASARAGNVIGGGDWAADRLIPDAMRAFLRPEPLLVRSPHSIRPWQHVLEPVQGYLLLLQRMLERGAHAEGWNFGADDAESRPVEWIVDRLAALWGAGAAWALDGQPQPHEARFLKLDCSKARAELGWRPRLPLHEALEWTVEWYQGFRDGRSLRELTESQIDRYQERATP